MPVPSDRKRRPFLVSLSLFLLLSALLVLLFLFLDSSAQSLSFLPSRLSSTPSLPPLPPQQQSPTAIPTPGSAPHTQLTSPAAAEAADAEGKADASRPDASAGAAGGSGSSSYSPRAAGDKGDAAAGEVDGRDGTSTGVGATGGDGGGVEDDDVAVADVRWETCRVGRGVKAADYIPCLDNVRAIKALRSRRHMEHRERHCPVAPRPRCLVLTPAGYRLPVPWPRSRDMIWYNNVPHPKLVEYKDQNWVTKSDDYLVFPGGGTQFKDGVSRYIQFIEQIMPCQPLDGEHIQELSWMLDVVLPALVDTCLTGMSLLCHLPQKMSMKLRYSLR